MAENDVVVLPVSGDNGVRSVQLPEGWLESAQVQARRIGQQIVLDPVVPQADAVAANGAANGAADGAVAWRYVDGFRVHPSWPAGYVEWLLDAQKSGELEIGDPDELRLAFNDPQPE